MKKSFNKKNLCLAVAALTLAAGVSVGGAMGYFTTYTTAAGGAAISLGSTSIIPQEEVVNMEKRIAVRNTGDFDCYARVKVLAGDKYQDGLQFVPDAEGTWRDGGDGYYYCDAIIPAGDTAEDSTSKAFTVKIDTMDSEDDFNVIVIQECTAVLYDEDGNPYADWDRIASSSEDVYESEEGGGE